MPLAASWVDRFAQDCDTLLAPDQQLGIAVSGGPDSLALLCLAAAARPGRIKAATVDHDLREGSAAEARAVAEICHDIGVPYATLTVRWRDRPTTAIQERARRERYRLLGYWAEEQGLAAIATGHHADDQAETLIMRLSRGAGVRGLAGMRKRSVAPGTDIRLIRPLLDWRRDDLKAVCAEAGLSPIQDPSNADDRFERVRVRDALSATDWLDGAALARSASHLADADVALDWAMRQEWARAVRERRGAIDYRPGDVPAEILRRLVARSVRRLASEGSGDLRGAELDHLLATLKAGGSATSRGVLCRGGPEWNFAPAPARRN